jgi:hypothetical protein
VIVRILGEGQYEVDDEAAAKLDQLDDELDAAVEARDDTAFKSALSRSVEVVRASGELVPDDSLHPAEVILPFADADVAEVLQLLADGQLSE